MKKLFILAALSVALNASADDQFLYWMIGDGATLDGSALTDGDYYAKVRTGSGSGSYLSLYASPDEATYGKVYTVNYDSDYGSWETFAGFASDQFGESGKFFVELYADKACTDWIGGADLAYTINNITRGGMGHYESPAVATTFMSVPEPTSGMLLLLGVAGLALRRKNKKA